MASFPNEFYCPITFGLMQDPVIAADGHTYEREAIEQWLVNNITSPKTNLPLISTNLIANIALRNTIRDMLAKQPLHFQTPKLVGTAGKIGVDVGLNCLAATSTGRLYGRNFKATFD